MCGLIKPYGLLYGIFTYLKCSLITLYIILYNTCGLIKPYVLFYSIQKPYFKPYGLLYGIIKPYGGCGLFKLHIIIHIYMV